MSGEATSLCCSGLGVKAGDQWLLRDIDVSILPGQVVAVVGPNGAGKSTLLGALGGDLKPAAGEVLLEGKPLASYTLGELAERRSVVLAPRHMMFDYTVEDVVGLGWLYGDFLGPDAAKQARDDALKVATVTHLRTRIYRTLSSGEKQRVNFARGYLQITSAISDTRARWFLLDEPTANLDIRHSLEMLNALRQRAHSGIGVLTILHDLNLAARFADVVVLLQEGRVVAAGAPAEVLTSERLTQVYATPVHVEFNSAVQRLTIVA